MPDRIFLDTNILIFYISSDETKKLRAKDLVFAYPEVVVSSQVIGEFISVCFSKNLLTSEKIGKSSNTFMNTFDFYPIVESTINRALQVKKVYKYSFWDSLIIASALENNCNILFSEDMQDGQTIEDSLKIVNPFPKIVHN